jgi:hypothetical protein
MSFVWHEEKERKIVTQLGFALFGLPKSGQRLTAINLGTW